jgi:inhibitor of KinA sporulation pathway (predicted exonuclease)
LKRKIYVEEMMSQILKARQKDVRRYYSRVYILKKTSMYMMIMRWMTSMEMNRGGEVSWMWWF